jgi:hypothetical protein
MRDTATTGSSAHTQLIIMYALLALYGIGSGVVGVATLNVVAGEAWGLLWPALVAALSIAALVGVIRSGVTEKHGWEMVATLLLVAMLAGYVSAIIARTLHDGEPTRLPVAILPTVVSIPPAFRLIDIARYGRKV